MKFLFKDFTFSTKERIELVDITHHITDFVHECGVNLGVCIINSTHSTTAIIVNEHEEGLLRDIVRKIEEEFPRGMKWLHDRIDDNASSHIASVFRKCSL